MACPMRLESGGVSGAGEPGVGGSGNMVSRSCGAFCRGTQVPYPPTPPLPQTSSEFSLHQRTPNPIDFWCILGVNLSLTKPRAGLGGPNSITKRHSLSVGNPNHPLLRSPRPSQRFEPEEGAWEPADHCCPERPPGSSQGDSKAGCWVTSLLPRQREGLTHRHEVRAVPGTQDGGSPRPARVLRAACDPCVCGGSSLRV